MAVIGTGPAGLSTAATLTHNGIQAVALEAGLPTTDRHHSSADELLSGVGGAGLFSDGKFSFFPSATALWALPDAVRLLDAYRAVGEMLSNLGLHVPAPPELPVSDNAAARELGLREKSYPSWYLDFESRLTLTHDLASRSEVHTSSPVLRGSWSPDQARWLLETSAGPLAAQAVVLAPGRFCGQLLRSLGLPLTIGRLEVGLRLQQPENAFFLRDHPDLDPKLVFQNEDWSWRTFCCCRNGETRPGRHSGMLTVSGRADCPPTGRSNVGILVRPHDPKQYVDEYRVVETRAAALTAPVTLQGVSGPGRRDTFDELMGPRLGALLETSLLQLLDLHPAAGEATELILPCIEGVMEYPVIDDHLRTPEANAYVVGDATGRFRGIVAALVSGAYVALGLARGGMG